MSKPINLYIAPHILPEEEKYSLLFPKPTVLFSDIHKTKKYSPDSLGYMSCPAVKGKLKKILTFSNALECSYEYDFSLEEKFIKNITESYLSIHMVRDNGVLNRPSVFFAHSYFMFADQPLEIILTPPYFHKPQYTNSGSVIPGSFDAGQWFRPFNFEIQVWKDKGTIEFKDGEPLFYAELMTDKKVNVHRFNHTEQLEELSLACIESTKLFGLGQTLLSRYNRFKSAGLREKVLTEIKKNIIEENFLTL